MFCREKVRELLCFDSRAELGESPALGSWWCEADFVGDFVGEALEDLTGDDGSEWDSGSRLLSFLVGECDFLKNFIVRSRNFICRWVRLVSTVYLHAVSGACGGKV